MKTKLSIWVLAAFCGLAIVSLSCSKDEPQGSKFDYPLEVLHGTWRVTHVEKEDGSMFDVTSPIAEKHFKPTYATFNPDWTYSGRGFFGNGSGTYKAQGKTVICYIDGEEYLKYDILSLSGNQCELKMYQTGSSSSIKLRCKKE